MSCSILQVWGFLSWFYAHAHTIGNVRMDPTCVNDVLLCGNNSFQETNGCSAFIAIVQGTGIVACSDTQMFLTLDNDVVLPVQSVGQLQMKLKE